jgi:hypothetical protein
MEIKLDTRDKKTDSNKPRVVNVNNKSGGPPKHWIELVQRHAPELLQPDVVPLETTDFEKTLPDSVGQVGDKQPDKKEAGLQTELKPQREYDKKQDSKDMTDLALKKDDENSLHVINAENGHKKVENLKSKNDSEQRSLPTSKGQQKNDNRKIYWKKVIKKHLWSKRSEDSSQKNKIQTSDYSRQDKSHEQKEMMGLTLNTKRKIDFEQDTVKKVKKEKRILRSREIHTGPQEKINNKQKVILQDDYDRSERSSQKNKIQTSNYYRQDKSHKQTIAREQHLPMEEEFEMTECIHWPILHDESSESIDSTETTDKWPQLIGDDGEWETRELPLEKKFIEELWSSRISDEQKGVLWNE